MDQPGTEAASEDTGTSEDQESEELDASEDSEGTSEEVDQEASEDSTDTTSEEDEEEPWVVPGRFKSQADLLRSYNNLESEFGRRNQEWSRREKETRPVNVDPAAEDAAFAARAKASGAVNAFKEVARAEAKPILDEARQTLFNAEYKTLMQNKEFAELEPTMKQIVFTNPDIIADEKLQNDPRLLHLLFLAAKGIRSDQKVQKAEKKGKRKGERDAIKKTKVQIEGSSGSKGRSNTKFEDLSLEQMKKRINSGDLGL